MVRPGHSVARNFAELCAAWLEANQKPSRSEATVRAVALASDLLVDMTRPQREMIAGTAFFDTLATVARWWHDGTRTELVCSDEPAINARAHVVHLATGIHATGGHTRVIEDIIRLAPQCRHTLLLTDLESIGADAMRAELRTGIDCVVETLGPGSIQQKFLSGLARLRQLAPDAMVAYGNPNDPLAAMLLAEARIAKRWHVHHADHSFSIVPARTDIPVMTLFPRAAEGLHQQGIDTIVPLFVTCVDPMSGALDSSLVAPPDGRFSTLTCGGSGKFRDRGPHTYLDLLRVRFTARDGHHTHIGPLSPSTLKATANLMRSLGREHDFTHIPFVPHLAQTLLTLRPSLYIGSFPMGGKRASVEAMAAACPITAWDREGFHCAADIMYPEHLGFADLAQFGRGVADFSTPDYVRHARLSRTFFETTYAEANLHRRLEHVFQINARR